MTAETAVTLSHGEERGQAVIASSVGYFLRSWVPQVLRLRGIYPKWYFPTAQVAWDPNHTTHPRAFRSSCPTLSSSSSSPSSSSSSSLSSSSTSSASPSMKEKEETQSVCCQWLSMKVSGEVKDAALCEYLDAVLSEIQQLLFRRQISDIAVIVWEKTARRPIERHVLSMRNLYAATRSELENFTQHSSSVSSSASSVDSTTSDSSFHISSSSCSSSSSASSGDSVSSHFSHHPVDDIERQKQQEQAENELQKKLNESLRKLWVSYQVKDASLESPNGAVGKTWTIAVRPASESTAAFQGWEHAPTSVIRPVEKLVHPVRSVSLSFGQTKPVIELCIEILRSSASSSTSASGSDDDHH